MSRIEIKTTQYILLFFDPASLGERIGAFFIDFLIIAGYSSSITYFIGILYDLDFMPEDYWSIGAIFLLLYWPAAFYPLITETLMQGQTVGKRLMKIRVIKIDGYQASFMDFFIRWSFGLIEIAFLGGSIALISVIASKYSQRLGDFASGTAVITERNKMNISHTILEELTYSYKPFFTKAEILLFSDSDVQIIKKYLNEGITSKNFTILNKLTQKITEISKRENTITSNKAEFIQQFLKDYNYYTGQ